ncbi:unnamed protein product [Rotaria socialis]|uniref:PNT domain-containing protein n=1 Tax=Rotaria socialis TaxID=392032 RepID=A0A820J307_9BILA|nr:unnamed protein product [Rotaria socialis]CAF3556259.1 unnamed protein product [Rotaria socialis]CAF4315787.1 unnamed protein product [Rotaria socialis]CAF4316041.1 unnamed protein product [Rotaria socialis]
MISHRLQSAPITGYYQYLSQSRHRVNVAPYTGADSKEATTKSTTTITTTTASPVAEVMNDHSRISAIDSSSIDNIQQSLSNLRDKDVTKWSSIDVQQWIEEQCQQFELKKATKEKFQMNGQALVLLTKHDFLRRSPDGGEILYYALQRLINPNKFNAIRTNQNLMRNGSSRQNPRIIEVGSDTDDQNSYTSSSTPTKPIVEEPDDPPLLRNQDSDGMHKDHLHQHYPHGFAYNNSHIRQSMFTMPPAAAAAYFHQQQVFPNGYTYAHHHHHNHHHHINQNMPYQQFFHLHPHPHPQFIHQYYPMMSAQGILIELIDNEDAKTLAANGVKLSTNETSNNDLNTEDQIQLFLITMNGQKYVMTEEQIKQFVVEVHQQQQQHLQQQQQHFQQQQFHQQYAYPPQQQTSQDNVYYKP